MLLRTNSVKRYKTATDRLIDSNLPMGDVIKAQIGTTGAASGGLKLQCVAIATLSIVYSVFVLLLLASNAGLVAGLVVFFVVILPLLVLGVFCGYRHRDKLRPYWQSTTTRMRNVINRFAELHFYPYRPAV